MTASDTNSKTELTIKAGQDFTMVKFIKWLNETFEKKSKTPFTSQDAYGYVLRGNLPLNFGRYILEDIIYEETGVRVIRVTNLDKIKKDA